MIEALMPIAASQENDNKVITAAEHRNAENVLIIRDHVLAAKIRRELENNHD
jgi:hypothetical protein